ncbi:MAG TPA: hypothetical protein VF043_23475 [Ktedonobacteraceae bacterium]
MKKRNLNCPFHAALAYQAGQRQYQVMVTPHKPVYAQHSIQHTRAPEGHA